VVIGPDDRARGEVMIKDLAGKGQTGVERDRVLERLSAMVRG
jgi:histidyl-tRNA synthetase